ncbi:MAG: DNA ligase D [Candidatus Dojkabacteria bacterium]
MALEKYNQKRDFKQTKEPEGKVSKDRKNTFVVQKHVATRLHFDFRIEHNGVLLSWAVPKGVPVSSAEKHLAMMVEDHPVSYYDFEGTIPEGNYGAGTVMVWDYGDYTVPGATTPEEIDKAISEGLEKGDLKLELTGAKLAGIFALVRFKKAGDNAWLFIKDKDEYEGLKIKDEDLSAKTGKTMEEIENSDKVWDSDKKKEIKQEHEVKQLPDRMTLPMLASLSEDAFDNEEWIFESKLDGYRAIAHLDGKKVKLISRNQIDLNSKYPEIVVALEQLEINAVLDGEITVLNKKKIPQFQLLQNYPRDKEGVIQYNVFDLLSLDNLDLRTLPLIDRKNALETLSKKIKFPNNILINDYVKTKGKALFKEMIKRGFEGVVAKKADSIYMSGERSDNWKKFKSSKEMECLICGYTEPQGNRKSFGSLLLGKYKYGKLVYLGNTGSGFDDANLKDIKELLDKKIRKDSPFEDNSQIPKKSIFVEPVIVTDVNYAEVTSEGMLRQAIFQRIRDDKTPKDITQNESQNSNEEIQKIDNPLSLISHPDKVYWPDDKYTKMDLAKYYLEVADFILPYLKDRPQNMNRHPDGIKGISFYHKDYEQKHPDFVKTYGIYSDSSKKVVDYILCNNLETLLFLANLGCIEMNPWVSTIDSIENPDYLIFDIDPNDVDFKFTVDVALKIHDLLDKIEMDNYIKTSGKRGLHINIPLGGKYTYENSREFSEIVARWLENQLPDLISLERSPDKRKGKIYIDYLQNRQGQTTASVYSARPVIKASVSTPLKWSEVTHKLDPKDYTIKTMAKRLDKVGDLWKPVLGKGIDMKKAVKNLQDFLK